MHPIFDRYARQEIRAQIGSLDDAESQRQELNTVAHYYVNDMSETCECQVRTRLMPHLFGNRATAQLQRGNTSLCKWELAPRPSCIRLNTQTATDTHSSMTVTPPWSISWILLLRLMLSGFALVTRTSDDLTERTCIRDDDALDTRHVKPKDEWQMSMQRRRTVLFLYDEYDSSSPPPCIHLVYTVPEACSRKTMTLTLECCHHASPASRDLVVVHRSFVDIPWPSSLLRYDDAP